MHEVAYMDPHLRPSDLQDKINISETVKVVRAGLAGSLDAHEEVPWDLVDRYLLPLLAAHASAIVLGTVLNTLRISQISSWTLFFWFIAITLAVLWFYHNLQVSAAGKSVFVTGADNKLGVAIVKQLDDLGFTVFAAMKNTSCDEGFRLKEICSGRLHLVKLDVTSVEQVQAARQYVQDNLPQAANGLWALINNEQWTAFGEVEWLPWEIFKHSMDVNVLGAIRMTQVFLPILRKAKGRVVCVSSIVGRVTVPLHAPFCASRAAVDAFADCLRSEMRRWGVDVVTVEPGRYTSGKMWVDDEKLLQNAKLMWEEMPDETRQDYGEFYFEYTVRKALDPFVRGPESDLSPAVRCLTDSVCRTFPLARYTAVTRADKLRALILHHLPRSVHDAIYE